MTDARAPARKGFERENKALHRANEILKRASAFFAQAAFEQVLFCNASNLSGSLDAFKNYYDG
ncbi:MAG TPA: hypothetical protein DEB56_14305 [Thiobacillus sp.]|nr:hypothetical protein [Thiobacillus sp.]